VFPLCVCVIAVRIVGVPLRFPGPESALHTGLLCAGMSSAIAVELTERPLSEVVRPHRRRLLTAEIEWLQCRCARAQKEGLKWLKMDRLASLASACDCN